ncbi:MAG: hypothetical protein V1891_00120 [bacterium]
MKNKNIVRIICGMTAVIIIAIAAIMARNKNKSKNSEWETYKNEELNIETKVPEGVEIEIKN